MAEYQRKDKPPQTAITRGEDCEAITNALLGDSETTPFEAAGRGSVGLFKLADGEGVLRRCRRGGVVGKLVNEGYLFKNRPLAEFRVHEYLYDAGVSVPEPLGVMWDQRGPVYRGAIATRRVEAVGLRKRLAEPNGGEDSLLNSVGQLIASMHGAGVYHADLHVENILVDGENAYLIDFDNARRYNALGGIQRARNLLRLRRSFQKWALPELAFERILAGYGPVSFPAWLDAAYRFKAKASDLLVAS